MSPRYAVLVTGGLLLSAVGDVCLVWPERFTLGLSSFLLAHCCYLAAFAAGAAHGGMAWPWLVGIAGHGARAAGRALAPSRAGARTGAALRRRHRGDGLDGGAPRRGARARPAPSGALALAGALVFMTSDGILAVDRFAHRFRPAHALVMLTYYPPRRSSRPRWPLFLDSTGLARVLWRA